MCAGCRLDMHVQPRYNPYDPSDFFGDGQSARLPVAGTVPRGELTLGPQELLYTGKVNGQPSEAFPFPVTQGNRGTRPRALQHFLLAVPRICRRWRRHDRAARFPPPAFVSRGPAAHGARGTFLRRDHQRLRRDVSLRLPRAAATIAGPSSPTFGRCNSAGKCRSPMCRTRSGQN